MNIESLTATQVMKLVVFMMIGGTILSNAGAYVGSDIWLVYLISTFIGAVILYMNYRTMTLHDFRSLPLIFERCFGYWGGKILCVLYAFYFTIRTKTVGDTMTAMAGDLLMKGASPRLTMFLLLAAAVYAVIKGLRAIATSAEIMFILFLFCLTPFFMTTIFTGAFSLNNLRPIFTGSQIDFWHKVFTVVMLPYTDFILMISFFHYVDHEERSKLPKRLLMGLIIATVLLIGISITNLAILGKSVVSSIKYPFYNAMMLAGVRGVMERLDPLAVILVIICHFFKGCLCLYAVVDLVKSILQKFTRKRLILVIGVIFLIAGPGGITREPKFMDHILIYQIMPFFQLIIPALMWIISEVKARGWFTARMRA